MRARDSKLAPIFCHQRPMAGADRELRGVVIDAHAHPALIQAQVKHPVRNDLAEFLINEVVDLHLFGLAAGMPLPPAILERADEFLLLGIHRDHRLAALLKAIDHGVDVLELRIGIRMRTASLVLRLLCKLYPALLEHSPRPSRRRPDAHRCVSACARFIVLLQVQRSGDIGSPRVGAPSK